MQVWNMIDREIARFSAQVHDLPVAPRVTPDEVRGELKRCLPFDEPKPAAEVVQEVIRLLRQWTVHVTHPRYFGLFNPSVRPIGIAAETLAALYNLQLAGWSHSPAANEMELQTLRHFLKLLGWDAERSIAHFTSGGSEANLSAVLAALARHHPEAAQGGLAGLPQRPTLYVSSETHHSFVKIARMTGLGTAALREVPTRQWKLDPRALAEQLRADQANGLAPLLVVATAGTTGAGLIDPLPAIADVARAFGVWFHVDAAWGGAAVLSPRLRPCLAGIERADSVTWDAHKGLSVPMGAGMFFCAHPQAVKRAFAATTSYMPAETEGESVVDQYLTSVQWSRRAIGLKVFMALAELGTSGYARQIEQQAAMGDRLRQRLVDRGWVIVNDTPLPLVCFTHPDIESGQCSTADILRVIYDRRKVWISDVVLGGSKRALRACVTSYHTTEADLDCLLAELEAAHGICRTTRRHASICCITASDR
jgi:glutamate/tyrosine decarboxylase-like PLP-dependent enzyme